MIGALTGGGLAIAGTAYNAIAGANAERKAEAKLAEQNKENEDYFSRRYNEDETQRATAQRMINRTADAIRDRNQAAAATKAVIGGTDASAAMAQQANANAMANAVSNISAAGDARKDNVEDQYRQRKSAIANKEIDNSNLKAQNIANAVSSGMSVAGSIVDGLESGNDKSKV